MNKYWVLHLPWIATCRHIRTPMIAARSSVSWSFVLYYQIPAKHVTYFSEKTTKQSEKESNIRYHYTLYSLSAFWLAKSPLLILRIHMILWTSMIIVTICSPIMRRLYSTQCECVIHLWLKNMSTWMVSSDVAALCVCPCRSTNKMYLHFAQ